MNDYIKKDDVLYISETTYNNTHDDFKGVWDVERTDWPNWEEVKDQYLGKRTWMPPFEAFGKTCLLIEGRNFKILSDKEFKKMSKCNNCPLKGFECEKRYFQQYGQPCASEESIVSTLNNK